MQKKRVKSVIERAKDGTYSIYMDIEVRELSYFITATGKTLEDAKDDFVRGYEEMKAYYAEKGKNFEEVEFEFVVDVVSFLSYYASIISLSGLSKITGIAKGQISHYVTGLNKPNAKNEAKILNGLRNFAKDMAQLG